MKRHSTMCVLLVWGLVGRAEANLSQMTVEP